MKQEKLFPQQPTYIVIDSSALCYRSFYTMPELTVEEVGISIVYGFLNQVLRIAREFDSNLFLFCWDSKVSLRKQIYPEYKQKRKENRTEEEIAKLRIAFDQFAYLRRKVLPAMGFNNNFIQVGMEADDLIAKLTLNADGNKFLIVSGDNDLYQLLSDNVSLYNFKRVLSNKWFEQRYSIRPYQWAQAKAIGGCSGDNVVGVKGIADPGKSKAEVPPAIKVLKGEKIVDLDPAMIKRNLQLIQLPYKAEGCYVKDLLIREDQFSRKKFIRVFDRLKFNSFLTRDSFEKWEKAFELDA